MNDDIGRCISRKTALIILENDKKYLPQNRLPSYTAALNRVKYEFNRHEPVEPKNGVCGYCGAELHGMYCANCGREVMR